MPSYSANRSSYSRPSYSSRNYHTSKTSSSKKTPISTQSHEFTSPASLPPKAPETKTSSGWMWGWYGYMMGTTIHSNHTPPKTAAKTESCTDLLATYRQTLQFGSAEDRKNLKDLILHQCPQHANEVTEH